MSTPIILKVNDTTNTSSIKIPATLNDTVAAQDFKSRLPFVVSGYRSTFDYCCKAEGGKYDSAEIQGGWKNGDISLGGGWFAVLFEGEEQSSSYAEMMIIAHIDTIDLHLVKSLPQNVTFTVEIV